MSSDLTRLFKRAVLQTVLNEGIPALLGKVDGTLPYVDANGTYHRDRVWARIGSGETPVETVVRCVNVPQTLNLPVIVADRDGVLTVIRTDTSRALDWADGTLVNVEPHNWTHGRYGPDPLYATGLSFLPLAAYPSDPPDLTVTVERCFYRYQGTSKVFERTISSSLAAYRPAGTEVTHYVILALDRTDNTLDVIDGADVAGGNRALPSASTVLATPGVLAQHFPICAIRFYNGQTQIMPRDIFMDLRLWAGESSASGSGAGTLGPTSSTDNAIARWDGTTGILLQDSYPTIDDSGNMDLAGNELRDYSHQMVQANTGAAYEIDWSAAGIFELTLTDSPTFTFANLGAGRAVTLILIQDGTGDRTVTWPGAVVWANATAPRLSSSANDVDIITLVCRNDGSTVSGFAGGLDAVEQQLIVVDGANAVQIQNAGANILGGFDERGVIFSHGDAAVTNFFGGADAGGASGSGATNNVFVGYRAGEDNASADYNTHIGALAGANITDNYDTLVGFSAGVGGTSAAYNAALGALALNLLSTGDRNAVLGYSAGYSVGAGSANTYLGASSGGLCTGSNNVYVGNYAGYRQVAVSGKLLIDNQQRADAATELTNALLYGTMAASPADQQLTINAGLHLDATRITDSDSPHTVELGDVNLFCDTDGGAITVNLAAGTLGRFVRIINCGSSGNAVTVTPNGAETIRGLASVTLNDGDVLILCYETTEGWW